MSADTTVKESASGNPVQPVDDEVIEQIVKASNSLQEKFVSLQEQLEEVKTDGGKISEELAARIDRILALMTTHAAYIKQLVDLVDECQCKTNNLELDGNKRALSYTTLVQRQNLFDTRLSQIENSAKNIVSAIKELQDSDLNNRGFQMRTTILVSLGIAVIGWVMMGDNLTKLFVYLSSFLKQ